jgi:Acetyltransferase (GNAT) domain
MRRLRERGTVGWRWHRDQGIPDESVEAFLALEHMDWKGEEGSSLRSCPRGEAFFREVVAGFASARRALFTELTLDGAAIASTCTLISGNVGFGFKIGWNPDFRAMSPGWLNEIEFMRHAPTDFGDIAYFDSGAGPSSFINDLWLTRRTLTTMNVPTRVRGACRLLVRDLAGRLKRSLSGPRLSPGVDVTNPAATDGDTNRRCLEPARSLAA